MTKNLSTWSPLSNVTVHLKPSRDYLKLLLLIHALAAYALFQSACPRVLCVFLMGGLIYHLAYLARLKTPGGQRSEVHYTGGRWQLLDDTTGELMVYSKASVRLDFGWMMWLLFQEPFDVSHAARQSVFVFRDQLSSAEHHMLRLRLRVRDDVQ